MPVITIPTITREGDANGAPHLEPTAYASKFSGLYEHRNITGGIAYNLPQEAPQPFAQAVGDVATTKGAERRKAPSQAFGPATRAAGTVRRQFWNAP